MAVPVPELLIVSGRVPLPLTLTAENGGTTPCIFPLLETSLLLLLSFFLSIVGGGIW